MAKPRTPEITFEEVRKGLYDLKQGGRLVEAEVPAGQFGEALRRARRRIKQEGAQIWMVSLDGTRQRL